MIIYMPLSSISFWMCLKCLSPRMVHFLYPPLWYACTTCSIDIIIFCFLVPLPVLQCRNICRMTWSSRMEFCWWTSHQMPVSHLCVFHISAETLCMLSSAETLCMLSSAQTLCMLISTCSCVVCIVFPFNNPMLGPKVSSATCHGAVWYHVLIYIFN